MSQAEIYEFLKENKGKKFFAEEIQIGIGINESSCMRCLVKLYKSRMIKREFVLVEYKKKKLNEAGKETEFILKKKVQRYFI